MKKLLHFLWLLTAPFLMASCSEDDDPDPAPFSRFEAVTVFSKFTNQGYLPKNEPASEMRVYSGDTLRYNFAFETNQGVKSFKVYDNLRGREWPLVVNGTQRQENGVTVADYQLEYLVNNDVVKAQAGETVTITIEAEDGRGTLYRDPKTGKLPEIKFTVASPLVYQDMKLYHYWGDSSNSLIIVDYKIHPHPRQGLISERYGSPFALLTNKMPLGDGPDNSFAHGFSSGEMHGNRQAMFVKVPASAKDWDQPNQMAAAMKQYGPAAPSMDKIEVGDVFAFKARYYIGDSWVIYGLIEVKSIVDDGGDTVTGTGHDEDYMTFDIKYFPGYRY